MASFGAFQSWMQYAQNDKCKWAFLVFDVIVSGENLSFILPAHAWGPRSLVPLLLLCTVSPVVFPRLRLCRARLRWGSYIQGNEWDPVIHVVCGECVWLWYCPQKDVSALPVVSHAGWPQISAMLLPGPWKPKVVAGAAGLFFLFTAHLSSPWQLVALNILTRIWKGVRSLFPSNFSEFFSFPYCLAATRW